MTENPNAGGVDPSTLRNVPEGLFDTQPETSGPTPATAFTPPYADRIDTPAAAWSDEPAPTLPPTSAAEQATFAPAAAATAAAGPEGPSLLRRWGAPVALVAAGLVGGMVGATALTNASAATPAGVVQPDDRSGDDGSGATLGDGGVTIEQLSPDDDHDLGDLGSLDSDDDGHERGHGGPGDHDGYSFSDGFSLRVGPPSTQGSTGASG
jgi:hypothetical protein